MRKYVLILIGLILAALVAGCGGGKHSSTVINAAKIVPFTSADLTGTGTGYFVTLSGPVSCNISGGIITAEGALQVTDGNGTSHTFTRLQSETLYWMVYDNDANLTVYRLYFDAASALADANAYYSTAANGLQYSGGLYHMGGAIQGGTATVLTTSSTVALYAGFANNLTSGTGSDDGSAIGFATFNQPFDVTTDGTNYYVVDYVNSLIRQITKAGVVTTWALQNSSGTTVTLYHPEGITTDGTYLYVTDTGRNVIRSISIAEPHVTTIIAGSTSYGSGSADSSTGTGAGFNNPTGITTDGTNLYVVDSYNNTIRKIVISSHAVSTLAGKAGKTGSANGTFTAARFYQPARITTDGTNLYVTDTMNSIIRSIKIATGVVSTIAGNINNIGHSDGTGTAAWFYYPYGITTDGSNLYVTDLQGPVYSGGFTQYFDNEIRKINISSTVVTTIGGGIAGGTQADYQDRADVVDGTAANARFATPHGIIWDGSLAGLLVTNGTYIITPTSGKIDTGASVYNCIFSIK